MGTIAYMAPELLGGKDPYNGPAVDVFACGQILHIMKYAKFAFKIADDQYYKRLMKDPVRAFADRNLKADNDYIDLVYGML